MAKKEILWKPKGMNRDLSVSAFSPDFVYENLNLRYTTNESNTQMSWVNERGPLKIKESQILQEGSTDVLALQGTVVGTCVISDYLVLFTTGDKDRIYRLKYRNEETPVLEGRLLYEGQLGFDADYPIETLASYESEEIQKVYWTDDKNPPRMLNIFRDYVSQEDDETYNPFDFTPELQLQETITVEKQLSGGGSFKPGVLQYGFTYYNKYCQETALFHVTPLLYVSHADRGGNPEDTTIDNTFKITVTGLDKHFDYLRIYSIQRTSLDALPEVKRVQDIALGEVTDDEITYTDTGRNGETVDPTALLYKGSEDLVVNTMAQKDNTLFLGNLKTQQPSISTFNESQEEGQKIENAISLESSSRTLYMNDTTGKYYVYSSQLTAYGDEAHTESVPCGGFKTGNYYRLGVQFQYKNGKWSQPVFLKDTLEKTQPSAEIGLGSNHKYTADIPTFKGQLSEGMAQKLIAEGYRKVRGVVVFPNVYDRRILLQGVVCPTLYTDEHRETDKNLYAQPSWFFRVSDSSTPLLSSSPSIEVSSSSSAVSSGSVENYQYYVLRNALSSYKGTDLSWGANTALRSNPDNHADKVHWESSFIIKTVSDITILYLFQFFEATGTDAEGGEITGYYIKNAGNQQYLGLLEDGTLGFVEESSKGFFQLTENVSAEGTDEDGNTVSSSGSTLTLDGQYLALSTDGLCSLGDTVSLESLFTFQKIKYEAVSLYLRSDDENAQQFAQNGLSQVDSDDSSSSGSSQVSTNSSAAVAPTSYSLSGDNTLTYHVYRDTEGDVDNSLYNPSDIRQVEIQGTYDQEHEYKMDGAFLTLHSPDLTYDLFSPATDYPNTQLREIGQTSIWYTFSDIDIQTETPTISNNGAGFVHKSFAEGDMYGIVSGLFYDDFCVDDTGQDGTHTFEKYTKEKSAYKWMVYLWNREGSLNNDVQRGSTQGIQSAKLKKKIISNLRFGSVPVYYSEDTKKSLAQAFEETPQLFSSDSVSLLKSASGVYMGNIDSVLLPDDHSPYFLAFNNDDDFTKEDVSTPFSHSINWKLDAQYDTSSAETKNYGLYHWSGSVWDYKSNNIGGNFADLAYHKNLVRIKYKSTPHLIFMSEKDLVWEKQRIPIVEVMRDTDASTLFGGQSQDALQANLWYPCGKAVRLDNITFDVENNQNVVEYAYDYGDTYYQRWDCLKTYAFSDDDLNQVVEIGSFLLESYINLDGRYDRNRGQISNINMSPRNFNLLNPVYSQHDNFFTYRILDKDKEANNRFPNQITWSLSKTAGADVDNWTSVALSSILELDGDKGELRKLLKWNDQLLAFQDKGLSQVLYNDNVQISSNEGVPIEIANSGKVQGKRYLTQDVGCSNKWSAVSTPSGVYFMDSRNKGIYLFNGQNTQSLSVKQGFNSWCKQQIPTFDKGWTPESFEDFVSYYDRQNEDVLFINGETALAYSEKTGVFTSFYDYGGVPYLVPLKSKNLWVRTEEGVPTLYHHQEGQYNLFFGQEKPYHMVFIANAEPQKDKTFTNLSFRANVLDEGTYDAENDTWQYLLPFDTLEVWDEYQHGLASLQQETGRLGMLHEPEEEQALKRKFRIWYCDIPRSNAPLSTDFTGIVRAKEKPLERMRNPWLYLKLEKDTADFTSKTELHDLVVTYYSES